MLYNIHRYRIDTYDGLWYNANSGMHDFKYILFIKNKCISYEAYYKYSNFVWFTTKSNLSLPGDMVLKPRLYNED